MTKELESIVEWLVAIAAFALGALAAIKLI